MASPVPSQDGSYCSYSSRNSTPQPDNNSAFTPIHLPSGEYTIPSHVAIPEAIKIESRGQVLSPHDDLVELLVTSAPSHGQFTMTDVNITSPQLSWVQGSDVTFTGSSGAGQQTSTEMLYVTSPSFSTASSSSIISSAASASGLNTNKRNPDDQKNPKSKPKRRRIINKDQRTAANHRERRRMVTLNDAFDILKERIPTFNHEKKLSRIETLRLAIAYISFMGQLVNGKEPHDVTINLPFANDSSHSAPSSRVDVMAEYNQMMQDSQPRDSMVAMDMSYVMDMSQQCNSHGYYPNGMFMTQ